MEIRQTVRNGIPIVNGIWYVKQHIVVPYRIWDTPAGRRLTQMQGSRLPAFRQSYVYIYQPEIEFPAMNAAFCFGRLRDISCGFVYLHEHETGSVVWLSSFRYAAPFVSGRLFGNRLLLSTEDGEMWQFDAQDAGGVQISIMQQSNFIRHVK